MIVSCFSISLFSVVSVSVCLLSSHGAVDKTQKVRLISCLPEIKAFSCIYWHRTITLPVLFILVWHVRLISKLSCCQWSNLWKRLVSLNTSHWTIYWLEVILHLFLKLFLILSNNWAFNSSFDSCLLITCWVSTRLMGKLLTRLNQLIEPFDNCSRFPAVWHIVPNYCY